MLYQATNYSGKLINVFLNLVAIRRVQLDWKADGM